MGSLTYLATTSLDGFVEDETGDFGFTFPSEEVHAFVNDLARPVRTFLFGRRMYDTMAVWETLVPDDEVMRDFAGIWHAADKVVYSTTLDAPTTARTRIERRFDPEAVRALVEEADAGIGGATIARHAFDAGLVDEVQLVVVPYVLGGGKPALPKGLRLDLLEERRFANGAVFLRYRPAGDATARPKS